MQKLAFAKNAALNMTSRIENGSLKTLVALGLTPTQARVYLSLVGSEPSSAKRISEVSNVPREHVYVAMPQIQDLGLVEKTISVPSMFRAIPIRDAVSILMNRKTEEYNTLHTMTSQLLQKFKNNKTTNNMSGKTQFIFVPKAEAGSKRRLIAFKNAQKSVDIVNSWKRHANTLFNYAEIINKAIKRGVKIRVITEKPECNNSSLQIQQIFRNNPSHKVRYVPSTPPGLTTIYDGKEAFIDVSTADKYRECPALWSNNPCLIKILQYYFETMWNTASRSQAEEE